LVLTKEKVSSVTSAVKTGFALALVFGSNKRKGFLCDLCGENRFCPGFGFWFSQQKVSSVLYPSLRPDTFSVVRRALTRDARQLDGFGFTV
jgi:hypothetical protein